jgi:S1-C subfamily serine protease
VDSAQALHNVEGLTPVGSTLSLDIRRDGKPLQLKATLKEQARAVSGDTLDPRLAGATFVDLPESLRQAGISGVQVSEVKRGSRAATSGLAAGDVITETSAGEFAAHRARQHAGRAGDALNGSAGLRAHLTGRNTPYTRPMLLPCVRYRGPAPVTFPIAHNGESR